MTCIRWAATAAVLALAAGCGGGGGTGDGSVPSVSTMSASPTRFAASMTIAIVGRNLDQDISVVVDGPCDNLMRSAGGTADAVQFTCTVSGVGEIVPRVKAFGGQREIASLRVNVPLPRFNVTLTDGSRSGTFVVELDPRLAPQTVLTFAAYASGGSAAFYRNTAVSFAHPEMGIRLGGFTVSGNGVLTRKAPTRAAIGDESDNGRTNLAGTVAMVRSQASEAPTAWWISVKDNPSLDRGSAANPIGYTVIGSVVDGLAVVETTSGVPTIGELSSGSERVPTPSVTISAISQTR